jgi:hypothetical protein
MLGTGLTIGIPPPCHGGTSSTPQSDAPTAGQILNIAAKKCDRQIREGWLKMINQEIEQNHAESGASTRHGIRNEIILKFQTSLPWLNRNGYTTCYIRHQKNAPDVITHDDHSTSTVSGLTTHDIEHEPHGNIQDSIPPVCDQDGAQGLPVAGVL